MKAAFLTGHGGNEVVAIGERPRPERRAGEVLVRLHAATVNRVDLYMRDSGAGITHTLPMVMGLDGAGVVEEIGADERTLRVGQRVVLHPGVACGRCEFCLRGDDTLCTSMRLLGEHRDGTFAEFVSLPARNVFPMPRHLGFGEAAALGVNHITAWSMVHGKAHVKPWETVLIFGAGSTFIAGADIREFGQPAKDPSLPAVIEAIEACPKQFLALGLNPEVIHRIASLATAGLDVMPHNGAVITALAVVGLTHKQAYKPIFLLSVVTPILTNALAIVVAMAIY